MQSVLRMLIVVGVLVGDAQLIVPCNNESQLYIYSVDKIKQ